MELYGFMEREKKIPSYFFIITKTIIMITYKRYFARYCSLYEYGLSVFDSL